jgi:uncharacterized protein YpiB (UPF0302 family)
MSKITVQQKRAFIKWFLNNYQLKRRECKWILNYILSHDSLLENLHFVENARYCERGIIMSTNCVDEVPFRFYKGDILTTDAEKCFHDIRLNRGSQFYIELLFKDKYNCPEYLGVLEDNPFDKSEDINEYTEAATNFLDYCLFKYKVNHLKKRIDEAIDNGDKELFLKLTDELSKIEKVEKKFKTVKRSCLLK